MSAMKQILSLTIGDQLFGIDIACISDVLRKQKETVVPLSGKKIAGLLNLRGHIVTLICVRTCLDMTGEPQSAMNITISNDKELYGLLFDTVGDIVEVEDSLMEPVPPVLLARWHGAAHGIYRLPQGLMILLDPVKLIESAAPEPNVA